VLLLCGGSCSGVDGRRERRMQRESSAAATSRKRALAVSRLCASLMHARIAVDGCSDIIASLTLY